MSPHTIRELPQSAYPRLAQLPGPLHGQILPQTDQIRVAVAEDATGQIVAYWVLSNVVHGDPLWLDPSVRGNPVVAAGLLTQLGAILQSCDVRALYVVIADPAVAALAERLGFEQVPGALYGIAVPPQEPEGSR